MKVSVLNQENHLHRVYDGIDDRVVRRCLLVASSASTLKKDKQKRISVRCQLHLRCGDGIIPAPRKATAQPWLVEKPTFRKHKRAIVSKGIPDNMYGNINRKLGTKDNSAGYQCQKYNEGCKFPTSPAQEKTQQTAPSQTPVPNSSLQFSITTRSSVAVGLTVTIHPLTLQHLLVLLRVRETTYSNRLPIAPGCVRTQKAARLLPSPPRHVSSLHPVP